MAIGNTAQCCAYLQQWQHRFPRKPWMYATPAIFVSHGNVYQSFFVFNENAHIRDEIICVGPCWLDPASNISMEGHSSKIYTTSFVIFAPRDQNSRLHVGMEFVMVPLFSMNIEAIVVVGILTIRRCSSYSLKRAARWSYYIVLVKVTMRSIVLNYRICLLPDMLFQDCVIAFKVLAASSPIRILYMLHTWL